MTETNLSSYNIKTQTFEGPLDLLLNLIEERKFFVNEISLAEVTNDYISHIKSLGDVPKEKHIQDVSYFVLIASTLILIKSKSLLPNMSLTEEEEDNIVDLETRLKLYKIIKEASVEVKNIFGKKIIFMPNERIWNDPLFSPDKNITKEIIFASALASIENAPKKEESLPDINVKKVVNIEEIINNLTERIKNAVSSLSFKDFAKSAGSNNGEVKTTVIISFLAMLEMVKEGIIDVIQKSSFEDIEITKKEELSINNN